MASAWAPGARDGQHQLSKSGFQTTLADQHIVLVEVGCEGQQHTVLVCILEAFYARLLPSIECKAVQIALIFTL